MSVSVRAVSLAVALVAIALSVGGAGAGTQTLGPRGAQLDPGLFQELATGVALIRTYTCGGRELAEGTGFLVGSSVVMTARHVLLSACKVKVDLEGQWIAAKDWGFWHAKKKRNGVAVDVATILLHDLSNGFIFAIRTWSVSPGASIAMIGHPLGALQPSITQGTVLKKATIDGIPLLANRLLVGEGSSGSPLLDANGKVVGIAQRASGSFDILGQLTGGVTIGIDLPSWWKTAKTDLCRAYPTGGIVGCSRTPPPAVYHVQACWAQYAPYGATVDPSGAATTFAAADILKGAYNYSFFLQLDQAPGTPNTNVTFTLVEPNGTSFSSGAIDLASGRRQFVNFGFSFSDGFLFFQHPETTGSNPWTLRWDLPDGETCSTSVTVTP